MATTKATTKKKKTTKSKRTTTKSSSARKKSSSRKRAKSTEQLRKEAIADIDKNLANADGTAETKAKATKKTSATKGKRSTSSTKAATSSKKKPATKRTPGILDHAASILASSKEPMCCKDIVEQAISKHGWKTSGKTPHATLYAAIIREISKKGKDARFTKVDRGRFTANGKATK